MVLLVQDHAGLNRQQAEALTKHLTDLILYQTQFTKDNFVTKEQLYRLNIQVHHLTHNMPHAGSRRITAPCLQMEAQQKQFRQEMQVRATSLQK